MFFFDNNKPNSKYADGGKVFKYSEWEEQVTQALANKYDIKYTDAEGIVAANDFYMAQSWGKDLSATETAKLIHEKNTYDSGEVNDELREVIVINEHTFAIRKPNSRNAHILHASVLKGSSYSNMSPNIYIPHNSKVRLANENDFDSFRVSIDGYKNDPHVMYEGKLIGTESESTKIKDWYTKEYSSDELGEKLNDAATFKDLLDAVVSGNDVYSVLGVTDSLVRERAFGKLSLIINKPYQFVYNTWLGNANKYADGGGVVSHTDLFEDYENIPPKIAKIIDKYSEDFQDGNYKGLSEALKEMEQLGYTFDYYLDGQAYGLRPIGVPLNQLKGYEDVGENYAKGGEIKPVVSYGEYFGTDGTVYNQRIKIDKKTFDMLDEKVTLERLSGYPRKSEYVHTSGGETYLKPLILKHNGVVELNHTQTRFVNLFLNLDLKDRNTRLYVYNMYNEGGEVDADELAKLDEAIKQVEAKIKAQGRITNARDEEHLQMLKNYRNEILNTKYADGGGVVSHTDLFEDYENIPPKIAKIIDKYSEDFQDGNYKGLSEALKEMEQLGYTFDYYLDGQAYGLRPIGVPLNQLKGYEDVGENYAKGGEVKKPFTFTNDKVFTKGDISVQRVGGSDMWEVAIKGKPMGRILGAQLPETAIKKAEKEFKNTYAKGGGVGDISWWEVEIKMPNGEIVYEDVMAENKEDAEFYGEHTDSAKEGGEVLSVTFKGLEKTYAKGGGISTFFDMAKNKTIQGYEKSKAYTKQKIKDAERANALKVIDKTKDNVKSNKEKLILKGAEELVESYYAKGGAVSNRLDELYARNNNSVDAAMREYAGELGVFNLYFGHKVDPVKKAKWKRGYDYLHKKEAEKSTKKQHTDGVTNERMYNFLKDDLAKLEESIHENNQEEIDKFFSYWNQHLVSLKNKGFHKNYERLYNFLQDDLVKLELSIKQKDQEEIDKFFSYWNQHLPSLKYEQGGIIDGDGEVTELVLKCKSYDDYTKAKKHFKKESEFYPFEYNEEFMSIHFAVDGKSDADITEQQIADELAQTDIENYYWESN